MATQTQKQPTHTRGIERIYREPAMHMVGDGFPVRGYIDPSGDLAQKLSPFLLLDYLAPVEIPPSQEPRGVGPHPHRGFETVSLAFEGSIAHHDSTGAGGVIGPGDVQWMTAGSGILHREYHEENFSRRGGRMHFAQIWVNLPKAHKMTAPRYQSLTAAQMGQAQLPGGGVVKVIAGQFADARGPAQTFTPIELYEVRLGAQEEIPFSFPVEHNAALLLMSGELRAGGEKISAGELALMNHDGEQITIEANAPSHFLLLAGQPIDEPVVQYGPFVMNSKAEIAEAVADYQQGKFGVLADR